MDNRQTDTVQFSAIAFEDYRYWQTLEDRTVLERLNTLIDVCLRTPFTGIGKPEPLKSQFSGYWSRRITLEHRLVYKYEQGQLTILACRFHYDR